MLSRGPAFGHNLKAPLVDVVVIGPQDGREGRGRDGAVRPGVGHSCAAQLNKRRDLGLDVKGEIVPAGLAVGEICGALGGDQHHLLRRAVQGDVVDTQVSVVVGLVWSVEPGREEGSLCEAGVCSQCLVEIFPVTQRALETVFWSAAIGKSPSETPHSAA